MRHWLPIAVILSIAACSVDGSRNHRGTSCTSDAQCRGDVCTRVGECADERDIVRVVIEWTIGGVPPSPQDASACARIDHFAVEFDEPGNPATIHYQPIPCELGKVTYDKMPPRLEKVTVESRTARRERLERKSRSIQIGINNLQIDFAP